MKKFLYLTNKKKNEVSFTSLTFVSTMCSNKVLWDSSEIQCNFFCQKYHNDKKIYRHLNPEFDLIPTILFHNNIVASEREKNFKEQIMPEENLV